MFRRSFLFLLLSLFATQTSAQAFNPQSETNLTAEILRDTLYAKTDAEKAYCDFVILQRDRGILPDRTLYAAYRYAVNKDKPRRFIYFQESLEILCKRNQIVLESGVSKKSSFLPSKATTTTPKASAANTSTPSNPLAAFWRLFRR